MNDQEKRRIEQKTYLQQSRALPQKPRTGSVIAAGIATFLLVILVNLALLAAVVWVVATVWQAVVG